MKKAPKIKRKGYADGSTVEGGDDKFFNQGAPTQVTTPTGKGLEVTPDGKIYRNGVVDPTQHVSTPKAQATPTTTPVTPGHASTPASTPVLPKARYDATTGTYWTQPYIDKGNPVYHQISQEEFNYWKYHTGQDTKAVDMNVPADYKKKGYEFFNNRLVNKEGKLAFPITNPIPVPNFAAPTQDGKAIAGYDEGGQVDGMGNPIAPTQKVARKYKTGVFAGVEDAALGAAQIGASALGATDVINSTDFQTRGGANYSRQSRALRGVEGAITGAALNTFVTPGVGTAVEALGGAANKMVTPDQTYTPEQLKHQQEAGAFSGAISTIGNLAGQAYGKFQANKSADALSTAATAKKIAFDPNAGIPSTSQPMTPDQTSQYDSMATPQEKATYLKSQGLQMAKGGAVPTQNIAGNFLGSQLASGGEITGPGTAKSDSIPANITKGSFIVPAENASIAETLRKMYLPKSEGKAKLKNGGVPVKLSNGEHMFSPDEAAIITNKGYDLNALAPNSEHTGYGYYKGGEVSDSPANNSMALPGVKNNGHAFGFKSGGLVKNGVEYSGHARPIKTVMGKNGTVRNMAKGGYAGGGGVDPLADIASELSSRKKAQENFKKKADDDALKNAANKVALDKAIKFNLGISASKQADKDIQKTIDDFKAQHNGSIKNASDGEIEELYGKLNKLKEYSKNQLKSSVEEYTGKPYQEPLSAPSGDGRTRVFDPNPPQPGSKASLPNPDSILSAAVQGAANVDVSKSAQKSAGYPVQPSSGANTGNDSKVTTSKNQTGNEVDTLKKIQFNPNEGLTDDIQQPTEPSKVADAVPSPFATPIAAPGVNKPGMGANQDFIPQKTNGQKVFDALGGTAGMLALGQTAFGASQALGNKRPVFETDPTLLRRQAEAISEATYGLSPEEKAAAKMQIEGNRRASIDTVTNLAGGNAGVALSNIRMAGADANKSAVDMAVMDQQIKREKAARADELTAKTAEYSRLAFNDKMHAFDQNQQAAANVMNAGIGNFFGNMSSQRMKDSADQRNATYGTSVFAPVSTPSNNG